MLAFDAHAAATPAAAATTPVTFVMCNRSATDPRGDLYATRDGHDTRQLLKGSDVIDVGSAQGTTVVSAVSGVLDNGMARLTLAGYGQVVTEPLPPDPDFGGMFRLSRDGRRLAWVDRKGDGHGGLLDRVVVGSSDGKAEPRTAAVVHFAADMDFDAQGRLHVLTQVAGHGSRISAKGAADVVLAKRTFRIRYGASGRLALSGKGGWAEVRDRKGRVVAHRAGLVVEGWARDQRRLIVLRLHDARLAYWNPAANRLQPWPRVCAHPVLAEQ